MRKTTAFNTTKKLWEATLTEDHVLSAIRALLELNGARVHRVIERIPWGKTKSEDGIPDLFGWFRPASWLRPKDLDWTPKVFFIEVKRPGGKLRPAQAAWLEAAQQDGVIAFKAESVEEMASEFKKYGIEIKGLPSERP